MLDHIPERGKLMLVGAALLWAGLGVGWIVRGELEQQRHQVAAGVIETQKRDIQLLEVTALIFRDKARECRCGRSL